MPKIKLTIASVLKPLKDPRAYYRFAKSLRETNKYSINIIGFSEKYISDENEVTFSRIFCHKRNHPSRILAPIRFIWQLFKNPPRILIVTTFELLLAAVLGKLILKYKLIYDVQENYARNLNYNQTQKGIGLKLSLAYIKLNEKIAAYFIDQYLFAESCYVSELPLMRPFLVLENKSILNSNQKTINLSTKKSLNFIISGTLTPAYGIEAGLKWFLAIEKFYPGSTLQLIGHVPMPTFRERLSRIAASNSSIQLQISELPIPYTEILEAYKLADCCIMPYQQLPSIAPKIPSKLYECLAMGIPVFFPQNPLWTALTEKSNGGREVDFFTDINPVAAFQQAISKPFFGKNPYYKELLWSEDEHKLIDLIDTWS
jgi:hypothetical protein